ncbi:MAG TPA: hypothetical protein VJP76_01775, partial [Candidatus Tumulicola sp.]|nr:hypothetical protein [Candidatus Tumulicola sp.]
MIVLAVDGALGEFSAAIARDGRVLASRRLEANVALERGLQAVAAAIGSAGVRPADIDRVAVVCGPGRFTGLR